MVKEKNTMPKQITKAYLKELVYQVNGAAIEVYKALGPGLLESVYHQCMKRELTPRNISFSSELKVPIDYKGETVEAELRCDFFVEKVLVVELKAIDIVKAIHEAQLFSYMNLLKAPEGILINFNVKNIFKEGQKTYVNEQYRQLPEY